MMRAEQELLRQLTCSRSRWNTVKLSAFTFHIFGRATVAQTARSDSPRSGLGFVTKSRHDVPGCRFPRSAHLCRAAGPARGRRGALAERSGWHRPWSYGLRRREALRGRPALRRRPAPGRRRRLFRPYHGRPEDARQSCDVSALGSPGRSVAGGGGDDPLDPAAEPPPAARFRLGRRRRHQGRRRSRRRRCAGRRQHGAAARAPPVARLVVAAPMGRSTHLVRGNRRDAAVLATHLCGAAGPADAATQGLRPRLGRGRQR